MSDDLLGDTRDYLHAVSADPPAPSTPHGIAFALLHRWGAPSVGVSSSLEALARFGAAVLELFTEYWGDIDGGDLQKMAESAGVFDVHVKQQLPTEESPIVSLGALLSDATGICGGTPCGGETEPGDTCFHVRPAVRAAMELLAQTCARCGGVVAPTQREAHVTGSPSQCDAWAVEVVG